MRIRRRKLLIEPPASATGDIAFNLIVFFLVCASVQPEKGIRLAVPSSETTKDTKEEPNNLEVVLNATAVTLDGTVVRMDELQTAIEVKLQGKQKDKDRVVVLKTQDPNTYAERWVRVVAAIKGAKGVFTLQIEEEQIQIVD